MSSNRRLQDRGWGESFSTDWLTGEESPNVTFQEGKWWTEYHYLHWRKDRVSDQRRIQRNKSAKSFLSSQPNDWE